MKYNTSRDGKKTLSIKCLNKIKQIKSTSVSAVAPRIADSKSLHNYTMSPGWTRDEVDILKIALQKFGIGKWKKIQK